MTKPDSPLTGFRRWLARAISPSPDPGEAWCEHCALNDGHTLLVSADGMSDHARRHTEENPGGTISYTASWPAHREQ
jgi:hypothetical protein